jgi:AcrR family transcriptional regulator
MTTTGTRSRRARHAELLSGLEEILLKEGFLGLSTDDFAARLRCSKSTLYRLAPSKEQLVLITARHFFARAAERIESAVADAAGPAAKVATYLRSDFAASRVRQLIHEGVRSGDFHVTDTEFVGQAVAVLLNSIHIGSFATMAGDRPEDVHAELSNLLLFGLVGPRDLEPTHSAPPDGD